MDSSSSVKEAVVAKDSCSKVTERPPTLRKLLLPASGGGNSTAVVTKEEGGHGVKLSAGMSSLGDRPEEKESLSDRMARYKEERRKQLASQYGQWSSSEDAPSVGEEPSYMRYSRRYKKKATTTGGDPAAEVEDGVKGNSEDARQRDGNGNNDDPSNCCKSVMMSTTVKGHSEEGDVCNNRHSVPGSPSKSLDKTHSPVEAVVRSNRASRCVFGIICGRGKV